MDNKQFCDELTVKLGELERYLQSQSGASPATREKALQHEKRRPVLEQVARQAADLKTRLAAARGAPSDADRSELEDKWAELQRLLATPPGQA